MIQSFQSDSNQTQGLQWNSNELKNQLRLSAILLEQEPTYRSNIGDRLRREILSPNLLRPRKRMILNRMRWKMRRKLLGL